MTLYPMPVGDPSGAGMATAAIPIAIELARRTGRPVQLVMSATGSRNHQPVRSPLLARMTALPNPAGGLAAWSGRFVTATDVTLPAAAPPYGVPAMRIEQVAAELADRHRLYARRQRGADRASPPKASSTNWRAPLGSEPLAFRMGLLGGNVAAGAGAERGGRARAAGTAARAAAAMGLACASAFGSHIALLAEAEHRRRPAHRGRPAGGGGRLRAGRSIPAWSASRSRAACCRRWHWRPARRTGDRRRDAASRGGSDALGLRDAHAADRGRAAAERAASGRGQRAWHRGACRGGRQCHCRRHRTPLARPAVRPAWPADAARRLRPSANPAPRDRRAADQSRHARRARRGVGEALPRRIPERSAG